ncbi:cation:proton antiporter [Kitasatospora sp. NPDC018058]|uniref:cation:proton antiporter domain-containing protein n=1 Tax=Kitasatospora sp. NPDC018058 TaxID=3364025 RepID=UPI0037BE7A67
MGTVLVLVVLATAVATFAGRLRVPAPSLLVLARVGVALIPGVPALHVPPQIIGMVVLPPLLHASAEELSLRDLRTVWRPVTILAFGLVFASAAAVGFAAVAVAGLPPAMAFVLGAMLSSTDPVAVTALVRRLALPGRVQVLVPAESLFNDATSLVLFKVAVGIAVAVGAAVSVPAGGRGVPAARRRREPGRRRRRGPGVAGAPLPRGVQPRRRSGSSAVSVAHTVAPNKSPPHGTTPAGRAVTIPQTRRAVPPHTRKSTKA